MVIFSHGMVFAFSLADEIITTLLKLNNQNSDHARIECRPKRCGHQNCFNRNRFGHLIGISYQ